MPTAEAHVPTTRASRYLVQLCRHTSQMGRIRHQPPNRHSGGGHMPPAVQHADWSDTHGTVRFTEGQWTLHATADTLTLRVEADDGPTLDRLLDGITRRVENVGRRDQLTVTWKRSGTSAAHREYATGTTTPPPRATARTLRGRAATIGLVVAAIVIVGLHLGPGGAALAASRWTSWGANALLAIILLKLILVIGHVLLGRLGIHHFRRHRRHTAPAGPAGTDEPRTHAP
jgi:hypothetical protein